MKPHSARFEDVPEPEEREGSNFKQALENKPHDIKVVLQFSEV